MHKETAINIRESLSADCSQCFGLCCTALNIVASSDFAINKPAETPCPNLQQDFRCKIHKNLRTQGFKGCTVFDCLGAGQKVSQHTFKGQSWREHPEVSKKMFNVFPVMEQLYEMIAFVAEALTYTISDTLRQRLSEQLEKLQDLTDLEAEQLLAIDMISCRQPVNMLLLETSEYIRSQLSANVFKIKKGKQYRGIDWVGKNLKGKDLRTTDLRGAYLIAANLQNADLRGVDLIGADLRDANISGANLSTSLFLTQMQINSAKGDKQTKLPTYIQPPTHWLSGT
ncbi:pentapeptide repeat-containing protein [Lysinibacillus louembei]|uniref:Pentapeptide repeat-containing protein n=1 Tax=Lysinibacillus louembei TaxID=1470088 RepID=A0ABZ0RWD3_9BACI|nr:pentapeptide repeat-containing protein [Lysinibacillus louembei]WPK11596.1 pentapeptide repeat-containing protein [Lysinibacillus louembei]